MTIARDRRPRNAARGLVRLGGAVGLILISGGNLVAQSAKSDTAALTARIQSLEAQLVDMQVVVGTLETLAKSGGGSSGGGYQPSYGGSPADAGRIDALENQIRAMASQIQQLSNEVRALSAGGRQGNAAPTAAPAASGFGATTVTAADDPIGGLLAAPTPSETYAGAPPAVATAALGPASDGANPKQLYETAYGHLLQRDYGAAEAAFSDFLQRFPNDSLSGNAQYWLGETHFVRGQYKAAASAFLKGYQTYSKGSKAPDSLLKLAMSLDRLGQKDAACSSYNELNTRFPNAPQSVRARAQSERQRVGCS